MRPFVRTRLASGMRGRGHQHVFLAHDQGGGVEAGQLEAVAVGDGVGGAGFDAVAAEDAAVVVDVVDLGVALGARRCASRRCSRRPRCRCSSRGRRRRRGSRRRTFPGRFRRAGDWCLPRKRSCRLRAAQWALAVGVVFDLGGLEDLPKGDAHPFGDGGGVANDGHTFSIRGFRSQDAPWIALPMV